MSLPDLHQWSVYANRGETLYVLDESDRFGPFALVRDCDQELLAHGVGMEEVVLWVAERAGTSNIEARRIVEEAVRTWMCQRAQRAWSLSSARGSCVDTAACGQ